MKYIAYYIIQVLIAFLFVGPNQPTGLNVTSQTTDSLKLFWNAVTNVKDYEVAFLSGCDVMNTPDDNWHRNNASMNTFAEIKGLGSNAIYTFAVRASCWSNSSNSEWSISERICGSTSKH